MQEHIVKSFDEQLNALKEKIKLTARACEEQLSGSSKAVAVFDKDLAGAVIKKDQEINRLQREIEEESVKIIGLRQPMAVDLRFLLTCIKTASELERIADYAANISKRVGELNQPPLEEHSVIIVELIGMCSDMLRGAVDSFLDWDMDHALKVWHMDNAVDRKFARLMTMLRDLMQNNYEPVEDITQLIFMGRCCERIGDHITNIAEDIYFMVNGRSFMDLLEEGR